MRSASFALTLLLVGVAMTSCASGLPAQPTATSAPSATPAPPALPSATPLPAGQEAIADVSLDQAIALTGQWRMKRVDLFTEDMAQPGYDDGQWREVEAPATWAAQGLGELTGEAAVVVYRRHVEVPADWQGQSIGISAWFNPYVSQVFVNGARVEPARKPFALYANVGDRLRYGQANTVVVTTLYDGTFEAAEVGPARLGILRVRPVTQVLREGVIIPTEDGEADATRIRPAARQGLPALVLIATGTHGMAEKSTWFDLADDLARQGYLCLALALPVQKPSGALEAVRYLRSLPQVDPERIVLFGADDEGGRTVVLAAVKDPQIKGVILLSTSPMDEVTQIGDRPILFLASVQDRRGLVLEQMQAMAGQATGPQQVVALPGDGHGTFVFTNAWNAARQALLAWLSEHLPAHP